MTDYDDYYDAAKKDGEPVIQGEHGGCIYRADLTDEQIDAAVEAYRLQRFVPVVGDRIPDEHREGIAAAVRAVIASKEAA
jgi:hypothetical protein